MYADADVRLQEILTSNPSLRDEWEKTFKLKKDPRITPFGAFLRKTSLDEFPQFWNVLKGDLSIVGPRPVVAEEMNKFFGSKAVKILSIRPGLTGPWQVSGRSDINCYQKRIGLDEYYVDHHSFLGDLKLILQTIPRFSFQKGLIKIPRLLLLFIYTLTLAFTLPAFFPGLHLLYFAPFLAASFYRQNKFTCLWLAILCGLLLDLFSSQTRLGFYALSYFLTVEFLYKQQRHFFEDSMTTLPLMTFLLSTTVTLIQVFLLYIFDQGIPLSWEWFVNDLFWNPLYDTIFATIAFTIPVRSFFRRPPTRESTMVQMRKERI